MNDVAPKTSLQATTILSSDQRGLAAKVRIEHKLLKSFSVSADFSHDVSSNGARLDARYTLTW
ncbi:hypothetical protein D3C87_1988320 [compost metagenome]